MNNIIYFDNAATTRPSQTAIDAWNEVISECWGNPSSIHKSGRRAKQKLEEAREIVDACVDAKLETIYFNNGGSAGDNWIIKGIMNSSDCKGQTILMSSVEHSAVVSTTKYLESTGHFKIIEFNPWDVEDFKTKVEENKDDIGLIVCMHVQNELGQVYPIKYYSEIAHKYQIPIMSDMVQSIGQIDVNLHDIGVDYAVCSGHKFGALRQSGFVYIKKGSLSPIPLIHGGGQEKSKVGGTEDVAAAYALACVLRENCKNMESNIEHINKLKQYFINKTNEANIPYKLNGDPLGKAQSGIGIVSIQFPWITGESLLLSLSNDKLDGNCICIGTGAACSAGKNSGSHVLKALGLSDEKALHTVRISFGHNNGFEEIDIFIKKLELIRDAFGTRG